MSLRNFVPSYPQLSVNPPPPHHQTHRVQALPVSVATALQQQISQQQQQQSQQGGSNQSNPNGGGAGNVQTAPSHEYHVAQCLPFQTPGGANIAPNFIRHMSNGGYPAPHPQNPYQAQGGPPPQPPPNQSNPAQPLPNSAPQPQGRLASMAPPTAPPTPPTQQVQAQQAQQPTGYAVPQGSVPQPRAPPQYVRPQQQQVRRQQQQQQQQQLYSYPSQPIPPYNFVIPTPLRAQTMPISAQHFQPQVYQIQPQYYFNPSAPAFSQMPGPPTNGQRQTGTPNAGPSSSIGPPTNDYSPYNVFEMPQVIQQPAAPPQQKTGTKKAGPNAIQIINPITRKNIFEEDAPASTSSEEKVQSHHTHHQHHHHNKEESVEKENAEPQTPVVSAMSDGPSVDITPKHQISKNKNRKPPEPSPQQSPVQSSQSSQPAITQLADPPKPVKIEAPKVEVEPQQQQQQQPVVPHVVTPTPVQDSENNNNNNDNNDNLSNSNVNITPVVIMQQQISEMTTEKPTTPPPSSEQNQIPNQVSDINDTNNNNYQKITTTLSNEKIEELTTEQSGNDNDETDRAVVAEVPQDTNNNSTETEEKGAIIESLIQYEDNQWSPANATGKKYYTRDQLLKLKDSSNVAPVQLPEGVSNTLMKFNKELLTNTLNQQLVMRMPFDAINSVAPKWMNTPGGRNPYTPKRPSQQGKQQVPGGGRQGQSDRQIIKLNLSLQDDIKLNESENAWKPTHLKKRPDMTDEERETEEVFSKFRSMLNKLTAENFEVLVEQVKTYKIDTMERLEGVIRLLFEKAISEPKFAPTYASLCNEIANIQTVSSSDQPQDKQSKKNSLKVKLITQCQKEFERYKEDSIEFRKIDDQLKENESEPDPQKREERKAELEEKHFRLRQRANGTVKFIGELYKIEMLTTKIMKACIQMLLMEATEEKVERVCKLLTTVGSKMEASQGRSSLQRYFDILNEMIHPAHKTIRSSRIKFEIQNLQDLRNNNWKARRQDLTPKTMDQMVWEAEQEQMMNNYQNRQSVKEDRQRGNQGYNKRQQPQQDSEGWSVQQNTKSRNQPIQLNKISLPSMSDSSAKLGNASQFQNFMMQTNKFAGLTIDGDSEIPPRFNSGSKNSSMERGDRGSRYYGNNNGNDNRYSGRGSSNQGSRNSSQIRSRDNSGSRGGNGGPSRSLQPPPPRHQQPIGASMSFSGPALIKKAPLPIVLTEEEVNKNVKELVTIVDLYRDDKLTIEAVIDKARKYTANKDVLEAIYSKFLDRKDNDRENLMLVVVEMIKNKLVLRDDNKQALYKIMQYAPDLECDVPLVYKYIAQFMGELLIANVLTFQEVYHVCQAEECDKEKVLQYIFTTVEKRHSANKLQSIVAETNCDLGQFIKDGNFGRWLENNKFTSMVRRGTRGIADVMQHIKKMLQEKNSNDNIMDYIKSTDCAKDPNFIRQLTTIVMEFCCDEYSTGQSQPSYKLNNVKLESLSLLLQKYIDNEINRELQCIYALQHFAFVREYPPGLLNSIFEVLYDNDVLSVEAFEKWKNSDDPNENQGKGVAVCSTRQFFTKLAEDEDDDDDTGSN